MPFTKHIIEPTNISQCPLPPGEPNELECLSNLTLANVIRQLSSLGQHAGRIFDDLAKDAVKLNQRTQILHQRIDNLKFKCSQLDIQNEEVSLHDFQTKKQFKSSIKIDQQVVSRKTMPEAIRLIYEAADPPPALDKLNQYRMDGKDCMKFYTDPEFFFNIWCNELMKDNETRKIEKKKRRTKGEKQNVKSPQQQKIIPLQENNQNTQQVQYDSQLSQLQQHQQQQHILLAKLAHQQPNLGILSSQTNMSLLAKYSNSNNSNIPSLNNYPNSNNNNNNNHNEFDEQMLPPPPHLLTITQAAQNMIPNQQLNNYQIYAESTNLNNGQKINKLNIQQASLLSKNINTASPTKMNGTNGSERPLFPPPPIPDNRLSDLQQIQHQLIKKYDANGIPSNNFDSRNSYDHSNDLPPPPSPPLFQDSTSINNNHNNVSTKTNLVTLSMNTLSLTQNTNKLSSDLTDSMFDIPLPPPPLELQDNHEFSNGHGNVNNKHMPSSQSNTTSINNGINLTSLPPPPPLPPLVESDTTSSSTSSLNAAGINGTSSLSTQQNNSSKAPSEEPKNNISTTSSRSYLDDINKRRYVLKPTQKSENNQENQRKAPVNGEDSTNGRDTIQPFVNNSDVAAIIDFIRKFRPHVCDSSEDEENSDWDE